MPKGEELDGARKGPPWPWGRNSARPRPSQARGHPRPGKEPSSPARRRTADPGPGGRPAIRGAGVVFGKGRGRHWPPAHRGAPSSRRRRADRPAPAWVFEVLEPASASTLAWPRRNCSRAQEGRTTVSSAALAVPCPVPPALGVSGAGATDERGAGVRGFLGRPVRQLPPDVRIAANPGLPPTREPRELATSDCHGRFTRPPDPAQTAATPQIAPVAEAAPGCAVEAEASRPERGSFLTAEKKKKNGSPPMFAPSR